MVKLNKKLFQYYSIKPYAVHIF